MVNMAVEVRGLHVRRGRRDVLRDLDLDVLPGTVTGLLGPSGCGKSTLIRAVAGTQRLVSGTVTVLGQPAGSPAARWRVGYATQGSSVYPDLTVRQNLDHAAALVGAHQEEVGGVLADVDLVGHATDLAGNLSGGQRARVSLAAALLGRPALLLLDEPTVGLDPVLRRDLWELFDALAAAGTTLLVSSHVMDEAARCGRVLLLREGRLLADDTPDGLRATGGSDDLEQAFLHLAEDGAA